MRPNFSTPRTVIKRYTCQNWPVCAEGSLFLAQLADSTLTADGKGYLLAYVLHIADSRCGQKRTVTFEYDRTKTTRDLVPADLEFGCCADVCVQAILGWIDVLRETVANTDPSDTPEVLDRYLSGATIIQGPNNSRVLRLTLANGGSPVEVTLPSEVVGSPNPYPTGASILNNEDGSRTLRITLSDATTVNVTLPTDRHITGATFSNNTLSITQAGVQNPITVAFPAPPTAPVSNAATNAAQIEGSYSPEQKAAGIIVRWTDSDGIPRVSIGNTEGWTHLFAIKASPAVCNRFVPSAAQQLSTTYADVEGSSITYTPRSANSTIVYGFTCHAASSFFNEGSLFHLRLVSGGNVVANSSTSERLGYGGQTSDNAYGGDKLTTYEMALPSWGTTARTLKLQAREYSTNHDTKLHETCFLDGIASSALVNAVLKITEILP